MRKVKVYTNTYKTELLGIGYFHQWGLNAAECNDGNITWSVAIVEMEDGTVCVPEPTAIEFIKDEVTE